VNTHKTSLYTKAAAVLAAAALFVGCQSTSVTRIDNTQLTRERIAPHLLELGARNWIVVADPAFPLPAGATVQCITVPADSIATFREVLDLLELEGAVVPRIWISHELSAVPETRAPGIKRYRKELDRLLLGRFHYEVNARVIDMQLCQAAKDFRVLYIRTGTRLPYSAIAIELDSGYWNADAEAEVQERLRQLMPPPPATSEPPPPTDTLSTITA
jgi:D-ribose pyranose/furanose isomerase RbsD